ncbi:hypothetical protein [Rickettsiales endosymbiont of Stachyamoeba lipophora]|uniref:hypothetical protein n=1 Tax=Rickettsiales endosymbiont of Stachyamoeba lipophora TaxID=2486578 RepID=UPI000F64ADFD|nr:hypothetical protein [Rickettsiales endosymbiont of Stachyamoeba lipophora]AZL16421.1 hypothetical protein EF513_07810 [Rickettsiales endosymbiont of Stachyamoeba lipophora]
MSNNASSMNAIDQESEAGITFFNNTANPIYIPEEMTVNTFQFLTFQELLALRGTSKQLSKLINATIAQEITANVDARILPSLTDEQKIDLLHVKKLKFENCNLETLKEYFKSSGRLTDHNSYLGQVTAQDNTTDPTAKQEVIFEDIELASTATTYNHWGKFCTEFRKCFTAQNKKQRTYKFNLTITKGYNNSPFSFHQQFLIDINSNDPTTDEILRHTSKLTLDFPITLEQAKMVINKLKQINPDCKLTIFNLIQQDDIINHALNEVDVSIIDQELAKHIKADSFAKAKPEVILGITFDFTHANIGDAKQKLTIFNNTNLHWKIILNNFTNIILFNDSHLLSTELNPANFPNIEFIIDTDGSNDIVTANNFVQQINTIATHAYNLNLNLASYESSYDLASFDFSYKFLKAICLDDFNSCKAYYKMLNQKHFYPKVKLTGISDYRVVSNIESQANVGKYLAGISRKVRNFTLTSLNASEVSSRQLNDILINITCIRSFILDATDQNIALEDLYKALIKRQKKGLVIDKIIIKNLHSLTPSSYKKFITKIISIPQNHTIIEFQNSNLSVPNLLYFAKACWLTTKKVKFNSKRNRTIFNYVRLLPYMIDGIALRLLRSMLFGGLVISTPSLFFAFFSGLDTIIISAANLFNGQKTNPIKYFYNNFSTAVREFFRIHFNQSLLKELGKTTCILSLTCFAIITIIFITRYFYDITRPESMENDRDFKLLYAQEPQRVRIPLVNAQYDQRNLSVCNNIYKAYKACGNFTRKILGERQAEQVQPTREA